MAFGRGLSGFNAVTVADVFFLPLNDDILECQGREKTEKSIASGVVDAMHQHVRRPQIVRTFLELQCQACLHAQRREFVSQIVVPRI